MKRGHSQHIDGWTVMCRRSDSFAIRIMRWCINGAAMNIFALDFETRLRITSSRLCFDDAMRDNNAFTTIYCDRRSRRFDDEPVLNKRSGFNCSGFSFSILRNCRWGLWGVCVCFAIGHRCNRYADSLLNWPMKSRMEFKFVGTGSHLFFSHFPQSGICRVSYIP